MMVEYHLIQFSQVVLRLVACLDLEALAEKRAIKSCNSFIFSSFSCFVLEPSFELTD